MQKINLRELYPDIYKTDTYLEVTDEVQAVFLADKRAEARYLRQMYNYKAHYSLNCDNGIEKAIVQHPPTPEEILENQQLRDQLYAAVMELPDKQAKWIYARFYLGMTVKEIAQAESVDLSWVYSIASNIRQYMTFAVLLTGNPVNALGKGIQGGNGVSIVINSKFIRCVPPFSLLVWINNGGSQPQPPGSSACTHACISGIIRCK